MKRQLVKAFVITIFALISVSGNGADLRSLVESKKNGIIDWTAGVVEARGIGIPATYDAKSLAQREDLLSDAISKAGHNLLETVVSLRINSRDRVIDIVENFPSIMTQLRDMAHKAPELERLRKYQYDGSVEVWSQMSLSGGFAQLILPPEIRQIEPIKQVLKPNSPSRSRTRSRSTDIFTGMVVDARGIQAVPVLAPRVLDENLEEVFGPAYVSREYRRSAWHGQLYNRSVESKISSAGFRQSIDRQSPEIPMAGSLRIYHQQRGCRQAAQCLGAPAVHARMPGRDCIGWNAIGRERAGGDQRIRGQGTESGCQKTKDRIRKLE